MRVQQMMSAPAVTVREDATLEHVARLMLDRHIGCVPVVRVDGRLCGVITESDFSAKNRPVPFSMLRLPNVLGHWLQDAIERVYAEARSVKASEVMTRSVVTLREHDHIETAIRKMCEHDVHRLPVVRNGVPLGIVSRQDLLRLMLVPSMAHAGHEHYTATPSPVS